MRYLIPLLTALFDGVLLAFSFLILFTVVGLSVMIFDAGESAQVWVFFSIICTICLGLMIYATVAGFWYFWKKKYVHSLMASGSPLIAIGAFQSILQIFF